MIRAGLRLLGAAALAASTLLGTTPALAADLTLASWNLKRLGHSDAHDFQAIASIASQADLLALQEVMTPQGLSTLERAIEQHTGESWSTLASHAIGSHRYKEMYAFLWRDAAVTYDEGAAVYLDQGDRFIREPFSAQFRSRRDGSTFVVGNVHILYGKGVADRTPEIHALANYWTWLAEAYPGKARILAGDFNLPPSDPAWAPLRRHAVPLITQGATTLSSKDGRYANLYDNVWVSRRSTLPISAAGILDFPKTLGWSHERSRRQVSDHAPVFVHLGSPPLSTPAAPAPRSAPANVTASAAASAGAMLIRGNQQSQLYHYPRCPSYNRIAPKNQVAFATAAAAQAAGYRLAGNCR